MARSVFVSGTDTGVGKTFVGRLLLAGLAGRGCRVGAMKPCETGGGDDAELLRAAAGVDWPLDRVRPIALGLAAAPAIAARAEGREVELALLDDAFAWCGQRCELLLVEGAGGLMVPLRDDVFMIDLAQRWQSPVILVARTQLGTINHTLLSVAVARQRGVEVIGVIFSTGPSGEVDEAAISAIERHSSLPTLGIVPPLARPTAALAERHLPRAVDVLMSEDG